MSDNKRQPWDMDNPASPCHVLRGKTDAEIRAYLQSADQGTLTRLLVDEYVELEPCPHCHRVECFDGCMCPSRKGRTKDRRLLAWVANMVQTTQREGIVPEPDLDYPWWVREALGIVHAHAQRLIERALARLSCPFCKGSGSIVVGLREPRVPCTCSQPATTGSSSRAED